MRILKQDSEKDNRIMKKLKTDLDLIPEVEKLRKFLMKTKIKEGTIKTDDLPSYVESLKKLIPLCNELEDRKHYKESIKYFRYKIGFITEILKEQHNIFIDDYGQK